MKISKKIAAMLSCVLVAGCIAGCKDKKQDSGSETEKVINISDIPQLSVIDDLDLTSYVSCEGGSGDFTVTIADSAKEFAHTDKTGKKIYVDHSGVVPFTVCYGGITKEGSATFISEEQGRFAELSHSGFNYTTLFYDQYGQPSEYLNFTENFLVDLFSGEGYAKIDEKMYSFVLADSEEVEAQFLITGSEPESIDEIVMPWNFDASLIKGMYNPAEVDEETGDVYEAYESMYIDDQELVFDMTERLFAYSVDSLQENGYLPTKVEFIEEAYGDEYCYDALLFLYGEFEGGFIGEAYVDYCLLDFNESGFVAADVAEYLATVTPEGKDISAFISDFDLALEKHNFEVSYSVGWYGESGGELVALEENPFLDPEDPNLGYLINHYLNAETSATAYVTENQTYIENGEPAYSFGLVSNNGTVYGYEGETHTAFELAGSTSSIFDPKLIGEAFNYCFLHSNEDHDSTMESIFVNKVTEGKGFEFSGAGCGDLFELLFSSAIPVGPQIEQEIEDDIEYLKQYDDIGEVAYFLVENDMVRYLACEFSVEVDEVSGAKSYKFEFVWDSPLDEEGKEYVYYIFSATFSNFEGTSIPSEVVVDFGE